MSEDISPRRTPAQTASWTAAVRAQESAREDALFNDPWAEALAGPEGLAWLEGRSAQSVLPIVLRTRHFDDFVLQMMREDGIRQVVILAAGYDTRAYRLDWPEGTRVYELDLPELLEAKQKVLDEAGAMPACERFTVGADLTGAWEPPLAAAGLSADEPVVWVLEGFLFYVPPEVLTPLLDRVMTVASGGSYLAFDIINGEALTSPLTQPWVEMQAESGAPWVGTLDDPKTFAQRRGWKVQLAECGSPQVSHGRWPESETPVDARNAPHLWFVTARRPWRFGEGHRPDARTGHVPLGGTAQPGVMQQESAAMLARRRYRQQS